MDKNIFPRWRGTIKTLFFIIKNCEKLQIIVIKYNCCWHISSIELNRKRSKFFSYYLLTYIICWHALSNWQSISFIQTSDWVSFLLEVIAWQGTGQTNKLVIQENFRRTGRRYLRRRMYVPFAENRWISLWNTHTPCQRPWIILFRYQKAATRQI